MKKTLFDKIWDRNLVAEETPDTPGLLYVGLHLLHDITAPQAFYLMEQRGQTVRRPELTLATVDHCAPTRKENDEYIFKDKTTEEQIRSLESYCKKYNIPRDVLLIA